MNPQPTNRAKSSMENAGPLIDVSGSGSQNKWMWIWRAISSLMVVFFLLCAFVQLNDADSYVWIPVYAIPALLCAFLVYKPEISDNSVWRLISSVHIGCCALGFIYTLILVIQTMYGHFYNPLKDEVGRELAGLGIVIFWLFVCRLMTFGSNKAHNWNMNSLILITGILAIFPLFMWSLCFVEGFSSSLAHCYEMFPGMLGHGSSL